MRLIRRRPRASKRNAVSRGWAVGLVFQSHLKDADKVPPRPNRLLFDRDRCGHYTLVMVDSDWWPEDRGGGEGCGGHLGRPQPKSGQKPGLSIFSSDSPGGRKGERHDDDVCFLPM